MSLGIYKQFVEGVDRPLTGYMSTVGTQADGILT